MPNVSVISTRKISPCSDPRIRSFLWFLYTRLRIQILQIGRACSWFVASNGSVTATSMGWYFFALQFYNMMCTCSIVVKYALPCLYPMVYRASSNAFTSMFLSSLWRDILDAPPVLFFLISFTTASYPVAETALLPPKLRRDPSSSVLRYTSYA